MGECCKQCGKSVPGLSPASLREGLMIIEGGAWVTIFAEYWGMGLMDVHVCPCLVQKILFFTKAYNRTPSGFRYQFSGMLR